MSVILNQPITNFTIPATGEQNLSLTDFKGQKLVIYFYPKDNTPGCTVEAKDFRDYYQQFVSNDTAILGVSRDSVKVHTGFKTKHNLQFDLLSDKEEVLCKLFDVIKLKKLYGKEYLGIERSTFLIDENGVLIKEWRKVRVGGHVEQVLAAIQE